MTRKCSYCSHNGHNSRTCPNRGVKLFGVRLTDGSIRKSASMGNLSHYASHHQNGGIGSTTPGSPGGGGDTPDGAGADGYASEDFVAGSSSGRERKKGVPWTEEEHKMFLLGLQKLGKGDWRGISRNYVITRTPTQVASHAQKYFIRQTNVSRRKRRSSLFDMVAEDMESPDAPMVSHDFFSINPSDAKAQNNMQLPAGPHPMVDEECESMASSNNSNSNEAEAPLPRADVAQSCFPGEGSQSCYPLPRADVAPSFFPGEGSQSCYPLPRADVAQSYFPGEGSQNGYPLPRADVAQCYFPGEGSQNCYPIPRADVAQSCFPGEGSQNCYPVVYPTYVPPFFPYAPFWAGYNAEPPKKETHEVVKPTAVHIKSPINVDELVGMSKLSLDMGESTPDKRPSSLSLQQIDGSTRQSAFHSNPAPGDTSGSSPIHAV